LRLPCEGRDPDINKTRKTKTWIPGTSPRKTGEALIRSKNSLIFFKENSIMK